MENVQKTLSFQDVFKRSVMKLVPQQMDLLTLCLTLTVALLLGLAIFYVYRKAYLGVVYDHAFNISLVVMTVLTTVIIITISSNVVLSLGMVGALSIVRYRTAVKNPLDLMFLFWAITTGIVVGAQYYYIAVIAFLFVTLILVLLKNIKGNDKLYVLIINYDTTSENEEKILRKTMDYKGKVRSKIVKNHITELTLEIQMKVENLNITQIFSEMEGVKDVTLVQYRGSYEL